MQPTQAALVSLVDYLAAHVPSPSSDWNGWLIRRVRGGQNNIVLRATDDQHDLAVKWTRRDDRDRAGREFNTLALLQRRGFDLAPVPLHLDREQYEHPVVVTTWLDGDVSNEPPQDAADWHKLVEHFATIHRIAYDETETTIAPAVVTLASAEEGWDRVRGGLERVPHAARPPELQDVLARLERRRFPDWPQPTRTLCRVDPNTTNIIRRAHAWASVDWENSGWGDAAFEIADILAHPAYQSVSLTTCDDVIVSYCALRDDNMMEDRIRTYLLFQTVDWAVFYTRKCYEFANDVPQKQRLVARPADWATSVPRLQQHYLARAQQLLEQTCDY